MSRRTSRPPDASVHEKSEPDVAPLPRDPAAEETADAADVWLPFQRLDAYRIAKELVRRVHEAKITDAELRDQATRAAKRTFLGLCEGLPNDGQALRRKYFVEANASLHEDARSSRSSRGDHGAARRRCR